MLLVLPSLAICPRIIHRCGSGYDGRYRARGSFKCISKNRVAPRRMAGHAQMHWLTRLGARLYSHTPDTSSSPSPSYAPATSSRHSLCASAPIARPTRPGAPSRSYTCLNRSPESPKYLSASLRLLAWLNCSADTPKCVLTSVRC